MWRESTFPPNAPITGVAAPLPPTGTAKRQPLHPHPYVDRTRKERKESRPADPDSVFWTHLSESPIYGGRSRVTFGLVWTGWGFFSTPEAGCPQKTASYPQFGANGEGLSKSSHPYIWVLLGEVDTKTRFLKENGFLCNGHRKHEQWSSI